MSLLILYATMPPSKRRPFVDQEFQVLVDGSGRHFVSLFRPGIFFSKWDHIYLDSVTTFGLVDEESVRNWYLNNKVLRWSRRGAIPGLIAWSDMSNHKNDPLAACYLAYPNDKNEAITLLLCGDPPKVDELLRLVPRSSLTGETPSDLASNIGPNCVLRRKPITVQ